MQTGNNPVLPRSGVCQSANFCTSLNCTLMEITITYRLSIPQFRLPFFSLASITPESYFMSRIGICSNRAAVYILLETTLKPIFLVLASIILFFLTNTGTMIFLFGMCIACYDMGHSRSTRCHNSHSSSGQIRVWRILSQHGWFRG